MERSIAALGVVTAATRTSAGVAAARHHPTLPGIKRARQSTSTASKRVLQVTVLSPTSHGTPPQDARYCSLLFAVEPDICPPAFMTPPRDAPRASAASMEGSGGRPSADEPPLACVKIWDLRARMRRWRAGSQRTVRPLHAIRGACRPLEAAVVQLPSQWRDCGRAEHDRRTSSDPVFHFIRRDWPNGVGVQPNS